MHRECSQGKKNGKSSKWCYVLAREKIFFNKDGNDTVTKQRSADEKEMHLDLDVMKNYLFCVLITSDGGCLKKQKTNDWISDEEANDFIRKERIPD